MRFLLQNHWEFQTFLEGIQKTLVFKKVHFLKTGRSAISEIGRTAWERGREKKFSEARCEFAAESVYFLNGSPGDGLVTKPGGELGTVGGEGDMTPSLKNHAFQKQSIFESRASRKSSLFKKCNFLEIAIS